MSEMTVKSCPSSMTAMGQTRLSDVPAERPVTTCKRTWQLDFMHDQISRSLRTASV